MYGIKSFYYDRIIKYKKKIINVLKNFIDSELESISLPTRDLGMVFLVDHNNIDKEYYNDKDLNIAKYFANELVHNNTQLREIKKEDAKVLLELGLKKRFTLPYNTELAVMIAKLYNENCKDKLLRIKIDIFRNICNHIDD